MLAVSLQRPFLGVSGSFSKKGARDGALGSPPRLPGEEPGRRRPGEERRRVRRLWTSCMKLQRTRTHRCRGAQFHAAHSFIGVRDAQGDTPRTPRPRTPSLGSRRLCPVCVWWLCPSCRHGAAERWREAFRSGSADWPVRAPWDGVGVLSWERARCSQKCPHNKEETCSGSGPSPGHFVASAVRRAAAPAFRQRGSGRRWE